LSNYYNTPILYNWRSCCNQKNWNNYKRGILISIFLKVLHVWYVWCSGLVGCFSLTFSFGSSPKDWKIYFMKICWNLKKKYFFYFSIFSLNFLWLQIPFLFQKIYLFFLRDNIYFSKQKLCWVDINIIFFILNYFLPLYINTFLFNLFFILLKKIFFVIK
jgi:hypothetical protein